MCESAIYKSIYWKTMGSAFSQMLSGERFVDMTLVCEGRQIHCHRVVLAACSPFFADLLKERAGQFPGQYPIVILPADMKFWMIQALLEFMYQGEVSVGEEEFAELSKCAKILKVQFLNNGSSVPTLPTGVPSSNLRITEQRQEVQPVQQQPLEHAPNAPNAPNVPNEVIDLSDDDEPSSVISIPVSQPVVHIDRLPDPGPRGPPEDLLIPIKDSMSSPTRSSPERDSNERYDLRPSSSIWRGFYADMDSDRDDVVSSWSNGSKASSDEEDPPRDFFLHERRHKHYQRSYTRKDMWAALKDVKKGLPISEASKVHNIPFSTLQKYARDQNIEIPNSSRQKTRTTTKRISKRRKTIL
ncbi:Myb/SANT-like DNA-binding domain 4 [Sergentomyia squamirostris]